MFREALKFDKKNLTESHRLFSKRNISWQEVTCSSGGSRFFFAKLIRHFHCDFFVQKYHTQLKFEIKFRGGARTLYTFFLIFYVDIHNMYFLYIYLFLC